MSRIIQVIGSTDDSFYCSDNGEIKTIRLIIDTFNNEKNISFEIVSEDKTGGHVEINELLGKTIKVTIEVE